MIVQDENLSQTLYIVYQPIPHRQRVSLWINGEKKREVIKYNVLLQWIKDSNQSYLIPEIMKTFKSYSFYLWDKRNGKAYYLQPNIHSDNFKDSLHKEIEDVHKNIYKKKKEEGYEEKNLLKRIFDTFTCIDLEKAKKFLK